MPRLPLFAVLLCMHFAGFGQMQIGNQTLYGNEWIDYSKPHIKLKIAEDGLYRIPFATLAAAGWSGNALNSGNIRLFHLGEQVPVFLTFNGTMSSGDYIEFIGRKNRGELDRYLWDPDKDGRFNTEYSMFNDTAAYFLTWRETGNTATITSHPNNLTNPPAAETWISYTAIDAPITIYYKCKEEQSITFSWFNYEGWASPRHKFPARVVSLPNLVQGASEVRTNFRYYTDFRSHNIKTFVNDSLVHQHTEYGPSVQRFDLTFPTTLFTNGTATIRLECDTTIQTDIAGIGSIAITYPRQPKAINTGWFEFQTVPGGSEKYYEITDFNTSGGEVIAYDLTARLRIITSIQGNTVRFITPSANIPHRILLINPSLMLKQASVEPAKQFTNYLNQAANFLFVTHPLMRNDGTGFDPVQAYANYRSSAPGGNYSTAIFDILELYDQYAYGINFHPFSVRNFLHRYKLAHPQAENVMIIGKALEYQRFRSSANQIKFIDSLFFVPTFGNPGTDQMFVMQNGISKPIMAIGRIAATSPGQITAYLDKVKQYELLQVTAPQTLEDRLWMKRILHLNGGGALDGPTIRNILSGLEANARLGKFGAEVITFESKSSDPVLESGFSQIRDLYQNGIAMMTFMGHSGPNIISFDFGVPSEYPRSGKYPVFAVFGCSSGACHLTEQGIGERFVLEPERCAIAYFASVSFGFTSALQIFGNEYYKLFGSQGYDKSQGWLLNQVVDNLKGTSSIDLIGFLHQFQYQGDPSIKLYHQQGSDYVIDKSSFKATPNPVSVEEPSFDVEFDVVNIGSNIDSLLTVKLMRALPNDTATLLHLDTIPAPANRTRLKYTIPSPGERGVGFNRFFVEADANSSVAELPAPFAEQNNKLVDGTGAEGAEVYFFSNDARPIWPKDNSIVSENQFTLSASTLSSSSPLQLFRLQIDTTANFNSPILKETTISSVGGLLSWKPDIPVIDSTVYYWRIARDTLVVNTIPWRMSSFTHIAGSPSGWNQSHYQQFKYNELESIMVNDTARRIEFSDNAAYVFADVGYRGLGFLYTGFDNHLGQHFTGDFGWQQRETHQGLILAVIDPVTGRFWKNPVGSPTNPSTLTLLYRVYDTRDSLKRIAAMQFLKDSIPTGHFVVFYLMSKILVSPTGGYAPEKWAADSITYGQNLFQLMEAQGATQIRSLETQNNLPYCFIYRHNLPSDQPKEIVVSSTTQAIQIRKDFFSKWDRGIMRSALIGPATRWKSAHWWPKASDHPLDQAILNIYEVREGQPENLIATLTPDKQDFDLTQVPAKKVNYLRLEYTALDTVLNTCTVLPQWRVLYDGVPEGAVAPNEYLSINKDTLQQGEQLQVSLAFRNISTYAFDSLLVRFKTEDNTGGSQVIEQRLRNLAVPDSLHAVAVFNTRLMNGGDQRLVVDFNPDKDQPELYHFNNIYVRNFFVQTDRTNPALRVTFDGRQILNNDIVSPKPEIVIEITDENKLLAMTDTSTFNLYLKLPNSQKTQIWLNSPEVTFFPADLASGRNRARIEYRPYLSTDGTYTLIVNGRDASGNYSAGLDYQVDFQVVNKSSLSNLINYPNPFSSSTCFHYTLTGLEAPDQLLMRIMTVSGKVVREVTATEFGPMQIGSHLSNFCWDGKDEFGDQLANGVYYYQVFAKKANGEPFELFSNSQTDGFFKHGIGKMVLMR